MGSRSLCSSVLLLPNVINGDIHRNSILDMKLALSTAATVVVDDCLSISVSVVVVVRCFLLLDPSPASVVTAALVCSDADSGPSLVGPPSAMPQSTLTSIVLQSSLSKAFYTMAHTCSQFSLHADQGSSNTQTHSGTHTFTHKANNIIIGCQRELEKCNVKFFI
eukprot:scpid19811/ scgid26554/ 